MGTRTCGACSGRGFTTESQWRPNPAGGLGHNVTIRRNCSLCSGSGRVHVPDPPRPVQPRGGSGGRTRGGGKGYAGGRGTPWGFKKKKRPADENIGVIGIGPDGELQVPFTEEELAKRRSQGAAGMLAFLAFGGVAALVGWAGTWVATLAPPTVASGATYLVVRRMGRAGVTLTYLVLAAMVIVPVLWVVKLLMDAP